MQLFSVFFCTVLWQMEMGLGTSFREHPVFRFSYLEKFPISLRYCSRDNLSYTNRTTVITIAELGQADKLKISDGLYHDPRQTSSPDINGELAVYPNVLSPNSSRHLIR